jgi:hypothetical protein
MEQLFKDSNSLTLEYEEWLSNLAMYEALARPLLERENRDQFCLWLLSKTLSRS